VNIENGVNTTNIPYPPVPPPQNTPKNTPKTPYPLIRPQKHPQKRPFFTHFCGTPLLFSCRKTTPLYQKLQKIGVCTLKSSAKANKYPKKGNFFFSPVRHMGDKNTFTTPPKPTHSLDLIGGQQGLFRLFLGITGNLHKTAREKPYFYAFNKKHRLCSM
jgi:hypothetical protein